MRSAVITRTTAETNITLSLNIDGTGRFEGTSGIGFFDHMLTLFTKHGMFDLQLNCVGDVHIDAHHTVEDVGLVLGEAFHTASGDKKGITRYGQRFLPMDEALVLAAVDVSGRPFLVNDVTLPCEKLGDFDTELMEDFFRALTSKAGLTLHIKQFSGRNTHHIIEAVFKACASALREAFSADSRRTDVPSTKGSL